MNNYKQFSAAQREATANQTKKLISEGKWPARPTKCAHCGQDKGILEWHNEDYSHPTDFLVGVCFRCHMIVFHSYHNPVEVEAYKNEIAAGKMYKPCFTRSFSPIETENKVIHPKRRHLYERRAYNEAGDTE